MCIAQVHHCAKKDSDFKTKFYQTQNCDVNVWCVHKKVQPNRSSRLAGYREHIYECLVLLYRLVERNILSVWVELLMYFVNFLFFYVYFFQETQIKEERKGVMCSSFQKIKWIWIQNEILIRISEKKINFKRRQPGFCLVCLQKS